MAVVSRLELNHPALGTAGGSSLHASIEALYEKIGDALSSRWFSLADFDQAETVDLDHNFLTDKANLQIDLMNFVGGKWVKLTDQTSPSTADFTIIEKVGDEKAVLQITNDTGGNDLTFAVSISFQPIYLSDGDVKDVVLTSAGEGHSLVFDDASKAFVNDSTAALKLPVGTTAQRPTPVDGHVRYNSDLVRYEGYKSGAWGELGGGGAGGKNYILNPDAAVDATTGVTADAGFSVARTTTAAELAEESKGTAYLISGTGLTGGTSKIAFGILATGIDDADGKGRFGRAVCKVLDTSGAVNGDVTIQVYDVDNSVYVGDSDTITGTGTYELDVPLRSGGDYEFHIIATGTDVSQFSISGITIEPVSQTTAGVIGKWQNFSVTSSITTNVTHTGYYKIIGNEARFRIRSAFTGATDNATVTYTLPNSWNIESSVAQDEYASFGRWLLLDSGSSAYSGYVRRSSSTVVQIAAGNSSATYTRISTVNLNTGVPIVAANNDILELEFTVPIAELANAHTPTASDVQYENSRARYYLSTNTSVTGGNVIPYDTFDTVYDYQGSWTQSLGTNGEIPISFPGTYEVSIYNGTTAGTPGTMENMLQVDSGSGFTSVRTLDQNPSGVRAFRGSARVTLNAGDEIRVLSTNATTTYDAGTEDCYIEITRLSDYSARKASLPFDTYQEGNLTADYTGTSTALTVSGLTVGNIYRLHGKILLETTAAGSPIADIVHDSITIDSVRARHDAAGLSSHTTNVIFEATATTITLNGGSTNNATRFIAGNNSKSETWLRIEDAPQTVLSTQYTIS